MGELKIHTKKKKEVLDITEKVKGALAADDARDGLLHLFLLHTTAALTIADLDPGGTDQDYLDAFERIVPKLAYRHPHNPEHMPDHVLSALLGISLTVPVKGGQLLLGSWQRIVLVEFDGPRERRIVLQMIEAT